MHHQQFEFEATAPIRKGPWGDVLATVFAFFLIVLGVAGGLHLAWAIDRAFHPMEYAE